MPHGERDNPAILASARRRSRAPTMQGIVTGRPFAGALRPTPVPRAMWIVELALKRPYTFIVMGIMILLATPWVLLTMPTDILPSIDIPVISIIWNYNG